MPSARPFRAALALFAFAACKAVSGAPDAGHDAGYHPQAPDGSVCDLGAVWLGDICAIVDCAARPDRSVCRLPDRDAGQCLAAGCRAPIDYGGDPSNCGATGAVCAIGATCAHGECFIDGGLIDTCDGVQCPAGEACLFAFCSRLSCAGATQDELCLWGDAGESGPWGNCCGGACTSFEDPANCGGCGVVCPPGYVCANEMCQPIAACGPGDNQGTCAFPDGGSGTCCSGTCVDLLGDARHCGNCGETCPTGSFCSGEVCRRDDAGSSPPLANCEDAGCPANAICATGWSCRLGSCGPDSDGNNCITATGLSDTCCGGICANTVADPGNCGGCGVHCREGEICVNNACAEPLDCASVASGPCASDGGEYQGSCCEGRCVFNGYVGSPAGDADCGRCGAACPQGTHCGLYVGTDPICFSDVDAGQVFPPPECSAATCPPGRFCTGLQCDPSDCTGLLSGAACALGVDGGAGICCGGACVSQSADGSCGQCGVSCPAGSSCAGGGCTPACVPDAGTCPGDATCQLPQGVCLSRSCASLGNGAECAIPGAAGASRSGLCCGSACIDPLEDPHNCGSCGAFCPSGVCSGEAGSCFDDAPQACLVSCGAEQLCSGALCLSAVCPYPVPTLCDSIFGTVGTCCPNRACADLTIDPANCGRCGVACTSSQTCVAGVCT